MLPYFGLDLGQPVLSVVQADQDRMTVIDPHSDLIGHNLIPPQRVELQTKSNLQDQTVIYDVQDHGVCGGADRAALGHGLRDADSDDWPRSSPVVLLGRGRSHCGQCAPEFVAIVATRPTPIA
jgi:hypothetical protein